jgi:excisionase family DNA binding protein
MKSQLITIDEAAAILRISKLTLYKYVSARTVPHVKVGARVLFREEDLSSWIEARVIKSVKTNRQ